MLSADVYICIANKTVWVEQALKYRNLFRVYVLKCTCIF